LQEEQLWIPGELSLHEKSALNGQKKIVKINSMKSLMMQHGISPRQTKSSLYNTRKSSLFGMSSEMSSSIFTNEP